MTTNTSIRGEALPRLLAPLCLVSGLVFVIGEAVSAAAFRPTYSYATYYISDLGVPTCGPQLLNRTYCSPLHSVMNAAFVISGALLLLTYALLWLSRRNWATFAGMLLAAVNAVGLTLVGLVHGTLENLHNGSIAFHALGALASIVGGNAAIVIAGSSLLSSPSRSVRIASKIIPLLGIAAFLTVLHATAHQQALIFGNGWWERLGAYTIVFCEIAFGILLVRDQRRVAA